MRRRAYPEMRIMARVDAELDHAAHAHECFALTQNAVPSIYSQEEWDVYREAYRTRWERLAAAAGADEPAGTG